MPECWWLRARSTALPSSLRSWLSTRAAKCLRGNITSKLRMGPNLLIKQGAKLVQDRNDVVAEFPTESPRHLIQ